MLVRGFTLPDGEISNLAALRRSLEGYAEIITPWAAATANFMLADVARRDARMWKQNGVDLGRAVRLELSQGQTGIIHRMLMEEQVALIKSLPLEASTRVHKLATQALASGRRSSEIRKDILRTQEVTEARARMIARTEVSRAASNFTQARAQYAGSEGYIWRTVEDADVRPTHHALNGKFIRWDTPPKTDKGLAPYHAGCGPNCRCFAEPVFPN